MATRTRVDPVTLQIVGNALASMADAMATAICRPAAPTPPQPAATPRAPRADEMATTTCRTAHSTVIRDGMDFSAVVCDAKGRTVAQAGRVPVHLGSIP